MRKRVGAPIVASVSLPARNAGLRAGDVILRVTGSPVSTVDEADIALARHKPGQRIEVMIRRAEATRWATVECRDTGDEIAAASEVVAAISESDWDGCRTAVARGESLLGKTVAMAEIRRRCTEVERLTTARAFGAEDAALLRESAIRRIAFASIDRSRLSQEGVAISGLLDALDQNGLQAESKPPREEWARVLSGKPIEALAGVSPGPEERVPKSGRVGVRPPSAADLGRFHALVIGNDRYTNLERLRTAVFDADEISESLRTAYGFEVTTLRNATRAEILSNLARLRRRLDANDNLLIYYAGHGWYDEKAERGYWLPTDADRDDPSNWISNADITDTLRAMDAKHVMIVADSCYSGTLTRGVRIETEEDAYTSRMARKRARIALTSGGLEPVVDGGGKGHSVFAAAFLDALEENDSVLDGMALFQKIRRPVILNASQTPEYGDIRFAGHEGGDFLFVRQ